MPASRIARTTLILAITVMQPAPSALALVDPVDQGAVLLPDFDVRIATKSTIRGDRHAALSGWNRKLGGGLHFALDRRTGTVKTAFRFHGALDRVPAELLTDPFVAGRHFIARNAAVFGLTPSDIAGLRDAGSYIDRRGRHIAKLLQTHDGVPLAAVPFKVYIDARGAVSRVNAGPYQPDLRLDTEPSLSAADAVAIATLGVGFDIGADLPDPVTAELAILPMADGARLVWTVRTAGPSYPSSYQLHIDASDGQILRRENLMRYASGRVWAQPIDSPCGDGDCLNDDRTVVSFDQRPATAPPAYTATWLDAATAVLSSNSVVTRQDNGTWFLIICLDGNLSDCQAQPAQDFDFGIDLGADPYDGPGIGGNTDANMVQLHYLNNFIHDFFYDLGFDEAAGNFQRDNFGLGGAGGDPVIADAQDGQDACGALALNNANFNPMPDGTSGKMQMYLWDLTSPRRDGDADADIVIHEFCHGLTWRAVGDMGGAMAGAMGESWGDIFAASISGDDAVGEYASGDPDGIRRYRFGQSPFTILDFATIANPPGPSCQVHADGEVWSTVLWRIRHDFLAVYPSALDIYHQMLYDSLTMSPPSPSFTEARDAMIQSAIDAGLEECQLWQLFAVHGLGYRTDGTRFDLPDDSCQLINDNDRTGQPIGNTTAGFEPMPGCECPASFASQPDITDLDDSVPGQVTLTWAAVADDLPAYDIVGYEVYRADTCSGPFSRIAWTAEGTTSFVDGPGLTQAYAYRVRAITTFGSLCGVDGACVTGTTCAPGAPDVTGNSLRLAGTPADDVEFFWGSTLAGSWNTHRVDFADKATLPNLHLQPVMSTFSATTGIETAPVAEGLYGVFGADGCTGQSVP